MRANQPNITLGYLIWHSRSHVARTLLYHTEEYMRKLRFIPKLRTNFMRHLQRQCYLYNYIVNKIIYDRT